MIRLRLSLNHSLCLNITTIAVTSGDGISDAQSVPKGLAFHPCAPGLLASRGLRNISLCDLTNPQAPCLSIGGDMAFGGVSDIRHRAFFADLVAC